MNIKKLEIDLENGSVRVVKGEGRSKISTSIDLGNEALLEKTIPSHADMIKAEWKKPEMIKRLEEVKQKKEAEAKEQEHRRKAAQELAIEKAKKDKEEFDAAVAAAVKEALKGAV